MKIDSLLFTKVISSLLRSGLKLQDALEIAQKIIKRKNDRDFLRNISYGVKNGDSLSEEINKYKKSFGNLYMALLRIGEDSGNLPEVFEKLEDYLQIQKDRREKLLQALAYPILILISSILVVIICTVFVFPKLEIIFEAFGESSEKIESKIETVSKSFQLISTILLFVFPLLFITTYVSQKNLKLKYYLDTFLLKVPFLGNVIIMNQSYDFCFSMKLLCAAYYPFSESLRLSVNVISNLHFKMAIENVYKKVISGNDVAESFNTEKIFPDYMISWINLSQQNGNLQETFIELYEYFKHENENTASKISSIMEPLFILLTGLVVIFMIVQFVLPIFKLMGTL